MKIKHSVFLLTLDEGELKLKPYPKLKAIKSFWNGEEDKPKQNGKKKTN